MKKLIPFLAAVALTYGAVTAFALKTAPTAQKASKTTRVTKKSTKS